MLKNSVKEWRQKKKISKAHLARQIGVCRSYVSKLERGNIQPSGEVLFRIVEYFKLRIEDIFQRVGGEKPRQSNFSPKTLPNGNTVSNIHTGSGQSDVPSIGHSARPSSGNRDRKGQIVGKSNGEGRGVPCRVVSQKEKNETN